MGKERKNALNHIIRPNPPPILQHNLSLLPTLVQRLITPLRYDRPRTAQCLYPEFVEACEDERVEGGVEAGHETAGLDDGDGFGGGGGGVQTGEVGGHFCEKEVEGRGRRRCRVRIIHLLSKERR